MKLFFMRHADAEKCTIGSCDCDRHLNDHGYAMVCDIAGQLKEKHIRFDKVFASPLVRAQETARLVLTTLSTDHAIITTETLLPSSYPDEFCMGILPLDQKGSYLFVGHQPFLGCMVSWLSGKLREETAMAKGTCYIIETPSCTIGAGTILDIFVPTC